MLEPSLQPRPDGPEITPPPAPYEPVAPAGAPTPPNPQAAAAAALAELQARENHDAKGRFLPGNTVAGKALTKSEALWSALADAKRELIDQLHSDLAINGDAAVTMEGICDAYAEARLLRHAMWTRLVELCGAVTTKGKKRALFDSYLQALDRETRLATTLGLQRRTKPINPLDAVRNAVAAANNGASP
jgi:hypothetical protein